MRKLQSRKTRGYIYRVAVAVGLVLVGKGLITDADFHLYEGVATAALALAAKNTPLNDD